MPVVTKNLLLINVIIFIASCINQDFVVRWMGMFYPASVFFRFWQPLTHMFVHAGFFHLFMNMYTLVFFGSYIERQLGTERFLLFYFVCGFGAALVHTGVMFLSATSMLTAVSEGRAAIQSYYSLINTPVVGASGAIYGLLIAFAVLHPDSKLTLIFPPVTLSAKWWVLIFLGIDLFAGLTGNSMGVANFAHLGGALFGFIMIKIWQKTGKILKSP